MLSRFVFCTLLVGCLAVPDRSKRSINGTKVVHTEIKDNKLIEHPYAIDYPYVIELLKARHHVCGGALVRPNFALTARHCFPRNISNYTDVSKYELLAGNQKFQDRKSSFVQVRQVGKIVVEPNYKELHDLAVVKVTKPFDLTIHVNIVKLPPQNYKNTYIGKLTVNLGWGATGFKYYSEYLQKVYGYIKKCAYTSLICTDGEGAFLQPGDSGGPTVIQGKERKDDLLIGIIQGILRRPRMTSVYLPKFANWINKTIESM